MQKVPLSAPRLAAWVPFILTFLFFGLGGNYQANSTVMSRAVWQPTCPPSAINGRLGSGSADYPSVSGTLLGRLTRNGIASTCNAPKTCALATNAGGRAYDAYTFRNNSSSQACVTVTLTVPQQIGANYQANSYLGSFDPNNICANYLADPGVSSATLSQPLSHSHIVPAGATFVVVVQTTNLGEIDGNYLLKVEGLPNCAGGCAMNCPANVSAVTTESAATVNYTLPTLTGNCANVGAVNCTPPPGSAFAVGTTSVTCSARDATGSTIGCGFDVLVSKVSAESPDSGHAGRPGSVLIFPIYTSSATNAQSQNTRFSLTNLDSSRSATVHLFLIDAGTCQVRDFFICLTAAQTTHFLAADIDPGTTGFIVAVAVDGRGCPANFNFLIGEEYVKFASGHEANLGADAIPAIAAQLPCATATTTTTLRFDGVSYAPLPRVVATSGFQSRADGNNTLLILNRIGGDLINGTTTTSALTSLVYDDAENVFSLTFNLTCQYRGSVWVSTRANPRFETAIPPGRSGWAKYYNSGIEEALLGATINLNQNSGAQAGAFNAGHNLHKLSYTTSVIYTIPVTLPIC